MANEITAPEIIEYMQLQNDDAPKLTVTIAREVSDQVTVWHGDTWPPGVKLGALMLGARLYRRRNSSTGVESVGGDLGTYVSRFDSDLDRQLQINKWSPPAVG